MGFLTDKLGLPEGVFNFLGGLFETGANYAAADDIMRRLSKVGGTLAEGFPRIGEEAVEKSPFKPFTITSGTGTTSALTDPETGEFSGVSNTLGATGAEQQKGIQNIIRGMLGGGGYNPRMGDLQPQPDGSIRTGGSGTSALIEGATPTSISDKAFGGVGSL